MNFKQVVVVGDSIIDHTVYGEMIGLSLETPTVKAEFINESHSFGGAANVVNNLLSLGQGVTFITSVSSTRHGDMIRNWCHPNLRVICLERNKENLVKSRYWLSRGDSCYKFMQINQGGPSRLSNTEYKKIISVIEKDKIDLVALVDYRGGIFDDPEKVKTVIDICNERNIKVISSSQVSGNNSRHEYFSNSSVICMNKKEALENNPSFEVNKLEMHKLFLILNAEICVTLGNEGAAYYNGKSLSVHPARPVNSIDTCGAGDSFLAALCSTAETMDINFCNEWAAQSTLERGTYVPTNITN